MDSALRNGGLGVDCGGSPFLLTKETQVLTSWLASASKLDRMHVDWVHSFPGANWESANFTKSALLLAESIICCLHFAWHMWQPAMPAYLELHWIRPLFSQSLGIGNFRIFVMTGPFPLYPCLPLQGLLIQTFVWG